MSKPIIQYFPPRGYRGHIIQYFLNVAEHALKTALKEGASVSQCHHTLALAFNAQGFDQAYRSAEAASEASAQ
jgi:glutamate dehydrogenase/leucine dehydrogenase